MFSIRIPFSASSSMPIQPGNSPRNGAMFKVPANWRELTVTHRLTGETEKVEVRIVGIGMRYVLSDNAAILTGAATDLAGHQTLWRGSSWVNAPAPCRYSGVGIYGARWYQFFWKTPVEAECVKQALFSVPGMTYERLDFAYELRTPNPLGMSSDVYTGSLSYTVGPQGDFDMGDVMLPSDSDLTLDFVLTVEHALKVDIPPGGDKVELVPQGGWQAWLNQGRKPMRLFRDQTFNISASSRFKMRLECEYYQGGNECSLLDANSGHAVPLDVSVSLPPGLTDASGKPVSRQPVRRDGSGTELFLPGFYVDRKPGTLHFEVRQGAVQEMLEPGIARQYRGNVTVVWDSEV